MSRLYHLDGSLAACPACHRLHAAWRVPAWPSGYPDWTRRICGLCEIDAPRDLVLPTELVRVGRLAALLDDTDWSALDAA